MEGNMTQNFIAGLILLFAISCSSLTKYPESWWEPAPAKGAPDWEILPQAAKSRDEVILSKRNELGILSNFAPTPFYYKKKKYASVEGFWQMMKYPDPDYKNDPRNQMKYPFTREQVAAMTAFEAKAAGDQASEIMSKLRIDWVTFEGERMTYCSEKPGKHYYLIKEAMLKKYRYNYEVRRVLLATGNLKLKPDHHEGTCHAPEWRYYELWMDIRRDVMREKFNHFMAPNMLP
jgi:predicted NAD-dependent protein-ADP-ribosyltransferase YbiA (DUF1768 family)